jgi:hypothetical protein
VLNSATREIARRDIVKNLREVIHYASRSVTSDDV